MAPSRQRERQPPVSLSLLEPEEVLAGLMQVKPEKEKNVPKIGDIVEVVNHANREVIGRLGTVTDIQGAYLTVSFDPPIGPMPGMVITFIEATVTQLKKVDD